MRQSYKKITSINDVRIIVSDVINCLLNDTIDNQTAGTIGTLCNIQLKILKAVDLDERLKKLENQGIGINSHGPVVSDIEANIRKLRN